MLDQYPDLLTIKDLQKALRVGRSKAYELIRSGEIRSIKIRNAIRIPKVSIVDYIRRIGYNNSTVDGYADLMEVGV